MKHYYLMNFIVGMKENFDGKRDLTQGLLIQPSTYPIMVVTNVAKQPSLDVATKYFEKLMVNQGIRSSQYIGIPCNDGEKISAKEGEWWLARTPALVLNIEQTVRVPKTAHNKTKKK